MPPKKKKSGKKGKGKKAKEVVTYGMWLEGMLKDQEKEKEPDQKTPNNDEFLKTLMNLDISKGNEPRKWMLTRGPDDDTFERVDIQRVLDKKVVILYFAGNNADHLDDCNITQELIKAFNIAKTVGKCIEVVLVPLDRKEEGFLTFVQDLPWYMLPLQDIAVKRMCQHYKLTTFPAVVVHDQNGKLVTIDGADKITREASKFPWTKAPSPDPVDQAMRRPNAHPCSVDDCKCNKFSQPGGSQWHTVEQRTAPAPRNAAPEKCNNCGHGDVYHIPGDKDGKKGKRR